MRTSSTLLTSSAARTESGVDSLDCGEIGGGLVLRTMLGDSFTVTGGVVCCWVLAREHGIIQKSSSFHSTKKGVLTITPLIYCEFNFIIIITYNTIRQGPQRVTFSTSQLLISKIGQNRQKFF